MSVTIEIELTPGDDIARASEEAQRLADLLAVDIGFRFNGVRCVARPGGLATRLAALQQEQQARKLPDGWKFASSLGGRCAPASMS
jgi:hypothetical protein